MIIRIQDQLHWILESCLSDSTISQNNQFQWSKWNTVFHQFFQEWLNVLFFQIVGDAVPLNFWSIHFIADSVVWYKPLDGAGIRITRVEFSLKQSSSHSLGTVDKVEEMEEIEEIEKINKIEKWKVYIRVERSLIVGKNKYWIVWLFFKTSNRWQNKELLMLAEMELPQWKCYFNVYHYLISTNKV